MVVRIILYSCDQDYIGLVDFKMYLFMFCVTHMAVMSTTTTFLLHSLRMKIFVSYLDNYLHLKVTYLFPHANSLSLFLLPSQINYERVCFFIEISYFFPLAVFFAQPNFVVIANSFPKIWNLMFAIVSEPRGLYLFKQTRCY